MIEDATGVRWATESNIVSEVVVNENYMYTLHASRQQGQGCVVPATDAVPSALPNHG